MNNRTDQRGNPVTFDQFIDQISESILANLIAFDRAGISRNDIDQIIGRDGGTLIGGGAMFQTPVNAPLTEAQGRQLFEGIRSSLKPMIAERFPSQLSLITARNNTAKKTELIKKQVGGR
jgi:hypothetical protein